MTEKIFELGERRLVTLEVWLADGTAFPLTGATWELYPPTGGAEASGTCDSVQDESKWRLTAEVQPKRRGVYRLQYSFTVGSELIKRSAPIRVV